MIQSDDELLDQDFNLNDEPNEDSLEEQKDLDEKDAEFLDFDLDQQGDPDQLDVELSEEDKIGDNELYGQDDQDLEMQDIEDDDILTNQDDDELSKIQDQDEQEIFDEDSSNEGVDNIESQYGNEDDIEIDDLDVIAEDAESLDQVASANDIDQSGEDQSVIQDEDSDDLDGFDIDQEDNSDLDEIHKMDLLDNDFESSDSDLGDLKSKIAKITSQISQNLMQNSLCQMTEQKKSSIIYESTLVKATQLLKSYQMLKSLFSGHLILRKIKICKILQQEYLSQN